MMAADTWELDRDLGLALARGDEGAADFVRAKLAEARQVCGAQGHLENPEIKGRCLKCGHGTSHPGPSICKASLDPPKRRSVA